MQKVLPYCDQRNSARGTVDYIFFYADSRALTPGSPRRHGSILKTHSPGFYLVVTYMLWRIAHGEKGKSRGKKKKKKSSPHARRNFSFATRPEISSECPSYPSAREVSNGHKKKRLQCCAPILRDYDCVISSRFNRQCRQPKKVSDEPILFQVCLCTQYNYRKIKKQN